MVPSSVDLRRSRKLAECVPHKHGAGHLLLEQVSAVRKHRRHAGPHIVACDDGRLTDLDASHVGDRIEPPGG